LTDIFLRELTEKDNDEDPLFLVDDADCFKTIPNITALISDTNFMEIGIVSNISFEE